MIGPTLFTIGPLKVSTFGVLAMLGFVVPFLLLERELTRKGLDRGHAYGIVIAAAVGGLLGARIYFIAEHWDEFLAAPIDKLLTGGLTFYGGLLGGILAVIAYARHKGIAVPLICDLAAPLLALGQAFGRMGCLLSGDGDYGPPSDVPWAMAFPNGLIPTTQRVHPTPIYDMIVLVAIFAFLWSIRKRPLPGGFLFGLYLVLVGIGRFVTEFYRTTPQVALGLTAAQLISVALVAIGLTLTVSLRLRARPA